MNATWIVSANGSRARIFSLANASAALEEVHDLVNEAARLRTLETTESDKRGPHAATQSVHNTGGALPNKLYEPPQSPEKHEAELFARDIVSYLSKAQQESRFDKLCLIVAPKFLGMLRSLLTPQLQAAVSIEIDKDYTQASPTELRDHLQAAKANG